MSLFQCGSKYIYLSKFGRNFKSVN